LFIYSKLVFFKWFIIFSIFSSKLLLIFNIDNIIEKNNITNLYIIKSWENDGLISNKCKNLIHYVFSTLQSHSDIYSVVGHSINYIYNTNFPIVFHIIHLPIIDTNLKEELNIPDNAIVFGRYGGKDSFDIKFVHDIIIKILNIRTDIYFIFMDTNIFYEHKNIIYLPGTTDLIYKRKFINTCDALIHVLQEVNHLVLHVVNLQFIKNL
jgi:hypothetical protein